MNRYEQLDAWVDAHFEEQVGFLQQLVRVPTSTPPGNNAPHAERLAELLQGFGMAAEKYAIPEQQVRDYGMESIQIMGWIIGGSPSRRVITGSGNQF